MPTRVLLVEDNEADILFFQKGVEETPFDLDLTFCKRADEVLTYLRDLTPENAPQLIFLDLNLPRRSGLDVLLDLRKHPIVSLTPVIVLTTSAAKNDIEGAYRCGANAYIVKPLNYNELQRRIRVNLEYWLTVVSTLSIDSHVFRTP